MRYRLKFGDAFAAQEYQMCLSVESAGKFFGPSLQVSNMRYQLKFSNALAAQNFKYRICVISESVAKFCDP